MTQNTVWSVMDKLEAMLQGLTRKSNIEFIDLYPSSPSELPSHLQAAIYGNSLPAAIDIPELDMALSGK